eukprot:6263895-Pyramimonas_sp.AAC.1
MAFIRRPFGLSVRFVWFSVLLNLATGNPSEVVECHTTKGRVVIEMCPEWAPNGAARFVDLVTRGYFLDIALFRKNPWIVQFGAVQHPQSARFAFAGGGLFVLPLRCTFWG